jgi:hypothetical protein
MLRDTQFQVCHNCHGALPIGNSVTFYRFSTAIAAIFFASIEAKALVSAALPLKVSSACVYSFAINRIRTVTVSPETR